MKHGLFDSLLFVMALVASVSSLSAQGAKVVDPADMNILVIGVEDWTTAAIGCYGNDVVKTPAVDALAARGLRFDRAYCQATVCQPSRASMATGLRPDSTRVYHNSEPMGDYVPAGSPFMAGVLKQKGDVWTAKIGKLIHLDFESPDYISQFDQVEMPDDPLEHGFQDEGIKYDALTKGYRIRSQRPRKENGWRWCDDPEIEKELNRLAAERDAILASGVPSTWEIRKPFQGLYAEQVGDSGNYPEHDRDGEYADIACQMLEDFAEEGKQFFFHVGFLGTHTPLRAPKEFCDLYDEADMPLPTATRDHDRGVPAVAVRNGANYDIFNQYQQTPENMRRAVWGYYACASYVDWCIAQVEATLRKTGLVDNTIVILYADHGFHLGEHGCWSKFTLFEQSTRIPLIVAVPGMETGGQACDEIVELVDLLPTLCDFWGIPPSSKFEGVSFRPLIADPGRPWKKAAYSVITLGGLGRSVRTRQFRYAEYRQDRSLPGRGAKPFAVELYDLDQDPWEQHNVANDPRFEKTKDEMEQLLHKGWQAALPPSR